MTQQLDNKLVEAMFESGVHYGTLRSSRNPSVKKFIYGTKRNLDIIDINKTAEQIQKAKEVVAALMAENKSILFAISKSEIKDLAETYGQRLAKSYISGRFVGGLLTNFDNIKRRINRMIELTDMKAKGELKKYTKKEQSLMDKEVERLEKLFIGVKDMIALPSLLVVVDPKKEFIAVKEAEKLGIPVIAIANTDCKVDNITYPIIANDSSRSSVDYILHQIFG